jgi:hypothetical protein
MSWPGTWSSMKRHVGGRWLLAAALLGSALLAGLVPGAAQAALTPQLYWANDGNTTIGASSPDGSGVNQSLISGSNQPWMVAIDAQHIYWANEAGNTIGRANLDGTGVTQSFITGAGQPVGVAVDGQHIYWTNTTGPTIGRANLDGTGVNQSFITGASFPEGLAVDGQHIYWANVSTGAIGRANLDGTGVNQGFISGANSPKGVAVDGQFVYWMNAGGSTIGRANIDGSGANQSFMTVTAGNGPAGVAVDGQHIYWTNETSTIGRANLDGTSPNPSFITGANIALGLAVLNAPGAPSGAAATAGNGQATVSFTAPGNNGSAITGYTVTASPGGATATGSTSPIAVTGLTNGTAYTFTVTATNGVGTGSASSATTSVTPAGAPGAPTSVSATAADRQATVSFTAPANNGSAITRYTVTASPGGATATGSTSPITITGLTNGTGYTFSVTASNSVGTSAASTASSAVTPAGVAGAPTGVSARSGDGSAAVSFIAPGSDGGAAIRSYTVVASPGGVVATGSGSPIAVSGLTNCTSYTFTVTATNAAGTGSASTASAAVVPTAGSCKTIESVRTFAGNIAGSISPAAPSGAAPTIDWPSGTFGSAVTVDAVTEVASHGNAPTELTGFADGSEAINLTFTVGGTEIHSFAQPVELVFPDAQNGVTPAYSTDGGARWVKIPTLPGTTLPAGQQDGYYRDASGAVHVLTLHATYFGVIGGLVLKTGNRPTFRVGSKRVFVFLAPARAATATVKLETRSGAILRTLKVSLPATSTRLAIPMPARAKAGLYLVKVVATSGPATANATLLIRLRH